MLHPYRPGRIPSCSSTARPRVRPAGPTWSTSSRTIRSCATGSTSALHLQYEQPHPALGERPPRIAPALRPRARSPRARPCPPPARADRPQPGRSPDATHGDRQRLALWVAATDVPFEKLEATPETRALLERSIFFEPCRLSRGFVFVATPHRGSFRVSSLVLGVLRRLITLPLAAVRGVKEVMEKERGLAGFGGLPNAVDNMRPGHRFVRTLSESPFAPGVDGALDHRVRGEGPPAGQNDGVVAYESAHLEASLRRRSSTPSTRFRASRRRSSRYGGFSTSIWESRAGSNASASPRGPGGPERAEVEKPVAREVPPQGP